MATGSHPVGNPVYDCGLCSVFFVTTFLGRVWCGYFCPQTVWTFIYIWFEEKLEGPANKRRKQDSMKPTGKLLGRKILKHAAWLAVALATGLTFVGYFFSRSRHWSLTSLPSMPVSGPFSGYCFSPPVPMPMPAGCARLSAFICALCPLPVCDV